MSKPLELEYRSAYGKDERVALVWGLYGTATIVAVTTTAARIMAKRTSRNGIGVDDFLAVFSTLCTSAQLIVVALLSVPNGLGRHVVTLTSMNEMINLLKGYYIFNILVTGAIVSCKLAVLAFYHRTLPVPAFQKTVIVTAVVFSAYSFGVSMFMVLTCLPVQKFWDSTVPGHCKDRYAWSIATNALNILSDFFVFLMPLPVLWTLNMKVGKKILICVIFSMGLGVCTLSVIRTIRAFQNTDNTDFSWEVPITMTMYTYEPVLLLLCINIPLIARALRTKFGSEDNYADLEPADAGVAQSDEQNKRPSGWLRGIDSIRLTGLSTMNQNSVSTRDDKDMAKEVVLPLSQVPSTPSQVKLM